MRQKDKIVVKKILGEIQEIESFLSGLDEAAFLRQKLHQKAVVMSLINIGELTKALSEEYRAKNNSISWSKIIGLRNLAAHHYGAVTMENIWLTVNQSIPELKEAVDREFHQSKEEMFLDI